jgi:hypothetical protein
MNLPIVGRTDFDDPEYRFMADAFNELANQNYGAPINFPHLFLTMIRAREAYENMIRAQAVEQARQRNFKKWINRVQ